MSRYSLNFKKILLIIFAIGFSLVGNKVLSSDNVLQAIQIDGVNDSYNVILKSDDVAELKKTIQAPNKMILTLKGIRASKTINTIYNNTSSVDSVVVEPTGEDSVKISIQAANASNAEIKFDTLKTPLGVLTRSTQQNKATDELVLNGPVNSYRPVYAENQDEENNGFSLIGSGSVAKHLKNALKGQKLNLLTTLGLFLILVFSALKSIIKGKDNEIKVGLTQSLREREIDMYRSRGNFDNMRELSTPMSVQVSGNLSNMSVGSNYGLKAYQNETRNPYVTSEIQRPRPVVKPLPAVNLQETVKNVSLKTAINSPMQTSVKTAPAMTNNRPKTASIDSMKFLESMTKIYEKNGRTDLAQGLKANMKKAKTSLV